MLCTFKEEVPCGPTLETSKCLSLASHLQPESASPGWIPDLGSTVIVRVEAAYSYPGSFRFPLGRGLCREGSDPQLALHPVAESALRMPVRNHQWSGTQRSASCSWVGQMALPTWLQPLPLLGHLCPCAHCAQEQSWFCLASPLLSCWPDTCSLYLSSFGADHWPPFV